MIGEVQLALEAMGTVSGSGTVLAFPVALTYQHMKEVPSAVEHPQVPQVPLGRAYAITMLGLTDH